MSGKRVDIVDHHRGLRRRRRAANTSSKGDVKAAECTLVRANAQQGTRFDDPVKPGPQMPKGVVQERTRGGHGGDHIRRVFKHQRLHLHELCVGVLAREGAQIRNGGFHRQTRAAIVECVTASGR